MTSTLIPYSSLLIRLIHELDWICLSRMLEKNCADECIQIIFLSAPSQQQKETSKECFSTRILYKRSEVVLANMLWQRSRVFSITGLTNSIQTVQLIETRVSVEMGCLMSAYIFRVQNNFPVCIFVLVFFSLTWWWSKVQHKFLFPEEIIYCAFLHENKHFLEQLIIVLHVVLTVGELLFPWQN